MAIYCPTILLISTMVSLTMSSITVDVITNYNVTRRNTYDVINNVTSQSGCTGRFESTKWTDGACRCYINHMFFVVEEKPGCFGSQQIDPKCELSQDISMTQDLTRERQVVLNDGIDTRVNCTRKLIEYNLNGKWMKYNDTQDANKTAQHLVGKVIRITYDCDSSMKRCLVTKIPGNDHYKLVVSQPKPITAIPTTNTTKESSSMTTTTVAKPTTLSVVETEATTTTTTTNNSQQRKRVVPTQSTEQRETRKKLMIALVVCALLLAGVVVLAIIMARRYLIIKKMTTDAEVARLHSPRIDETNMDAREKK